MSSRGARRSQAQLQAEEQNEDTSGSDSDTSVKDSEAEGRHEEGREEVEESEASSSDGNYSEEEGEIEEKIKVERKQEKKVKEKKSIIRKEAEKYSEKLSRRGVIYISRVPPFMKPNKLRSMLDGYGEISRLYLAEEDASVRKKRKAKGGNGSKQFVEGWIEFDNKKVARKVAESLNGTRMGGKKRDYYHDDIWNLKYLKGFKWDHLTEKFAYERRVRESKLKAAMLQAKRQNAEFVEMLDKDEAYQHVKKRGQKRQQFENSGEEIDESRKQSKRSFKQLRGSTSLDEGRTVQDGVVSAIFA